jgi:hypothetical protein
MPTVLVYFALIILATIGVSIAGAWFLKKYIGNRAYWLVPVPLILFIGIGWTKGRLEQPGDFTPELQPAAKLSGLVRGLPDYASFGYSGAAFYKDRLYVSTNLGLLVVDGAQVSGIYRVQRTYSVVSGPWLDPANNLLWILDDQTGQFLNFNGATWHRVNTPKPEHGYFSRGDVLEGPQPVGNGSGFWMEYGSRVWQWNAAANAWSAELEPLQASTSSGFAQGIGVLPIKQKLLFIERREPLPFLHRDGQDFDSDIVLDSDGSETPNNSGTKFLAESWAVADDAAYICTQRGEVLRVTPQTIAKLDTPGKCEIISAATTHAPLVSFRNKGIYEYQGNWVLRAPHPYPSGDGDYWTYLDENGSQIAVAITAKPVTDTKRSSGADMKFTRNAPTQLWLYQNSQFRLVPIP